ncbi:hypothetical protein [Natronolimnohabitans innermongolicus]|uniref:Uncharacterized protein n=1 Tax=Natronolimnohabitans innermongolicus JCM 12255 TaxID=1227499 RepID=L9X8U3_9EURY|nr:hypothetical protein [Natronolimnohabitans innermongolicus]ELY57038.1 hypothetical protein C493_09428 [Natronolimnohabitans innermongolicus JCM 12255]
MPDYRYTEVVFCKSCGYVSSRDPQFKGFMDRIDTDILTAECEECGEVNWGKRHEQDAHLRDQRHP